jgi:hypothetical protein
MIRLIVKPARDPDDLSAHIPASVDRRPDRTLDPNLAMSND